MTKTEKELDSKTADLLKQVVEEFWKEDAEVRERQVREWRRLKLLWDGYSRIWFSEVAHDWRVDSSSELNDQDAYDHPINVFRAYLESIIAALSVTVPPIKCYPDDADNSLDISTARAGDKIAQLIFRHNNANLLWLNALFVYVTEGMVACYRYTKESEAFGTYDEKSYDEAEELHHITNCTNCGATLADEVVPPGTMLPPPIPQEMPPEMMGGMSGMDPTMNPGMTEGTMPVESMDGSIPPFDMTDSFGTMKGMSGGAFPPGESVIPEIEMFDQFDPEGTELCPECQMKMIPSVEEKSTIVTRLVGITQNPKSRQCLEILGGLYVKIPNYAKKQSDIPYLFYSYETNYALARERYADNDELRDKIGPRAGNTTNEYERYARMNPQYQGDESSSNVTIRNGWLRPAAFQVLDKEEAKYLRKKFPIGVKVVLVNDTLCEYEAESLDDAWTLTNNPMSDFLHFDPLGKGLISIQELTNDMFSLVPQTIEHGIPQTMADPEVLNFNMYKSQETTPGAIIPVTPKPGHALNESFYEVKTATLSQEILPFMQEIQSMGQLVSGALPSLFGGDIQGSKTASQYSMSRAQALQRQQNTWKMFCSWWKEIFGKAIPAYIKDMKEDEHFVDKDTSGNFINVFIRKADVEGKIGQIELEANENLPITWTQMRDIVKELMMSSNPQIVEMLATAENLPKIYDALGLTDFEVPGLDARNKQYEEIAQLVNSEPIMVPNQIDMAAIEAAAMAGEPPPPEEIPESSIIAEEFDDHSTELAVCIKWINSPAGQLAKTKNPLGYQNVVLHAKSHKTIIDEMMAAQSQMMEPPPDGKKPPNGDSKTPTKKARETDQEAPIMGEGNVATN